MSVCHCTNQCRTCGACCQTGCGHRGTARAITTAPNVPTWWPPSSNWPHGDLSAPPPPLTEKQVREIVREEMEEVLEHALGTLLQALLKGKLPQYRDQDPLDGGLS